MHTIRSIHTKLTTGAKQAGRDKLLLLCCFVLALVFALALRYTIRGAETFDYVMFLRPWLEALREQGLGALNGGLPGGNYNAPYYLLLYLGSFLPIADIVIVKMISIFFDLVLALAVYKVVRHLRPLGVMPYVASLVVLFLPTVFLNSSMWGQCDAIYTSFVILALYACLKNSARWAWLLWGVAFSFKLQAIFFLPFLVFFTFYKGWKVRTALIAVLVFAIAALPTVIAGASITDALQVYVNQAKNPTAGQPMLSWFAPTFGQLYPSGDVQYDYFKNSLLIMGAVTGLATVSLAFIRKKFSDEMLVLIATISVLSIAFLLPGIHERYLYTAEVLLVLVAFAVPRTAWAVVAMQVTSIITYNSYFSGGNQPPQIPYAWLAVGVLGILYALIRTALQEVTKLHTPSRDLKSKA